MSHVAAAEIMPFRDAKSGVQIVHDWTPDHGILLAMSRALRRAAEAAQRRPKKITERRLRQPITPAVFEELQRALAEPDLLASIRAHQPEECPPGHLFCPHCGQLHRRDLLLRISIRTPSGVPDAVVQEGLLCSFPACQQPIWMDAIGVGPEAASGEAPG